MALIAAHQLTYTYPKSSRPAFQDLSFEIGAGQFTALLGGSGSGKSTLMLALAGIVPEFYGGEWSGSLRIGEVWVEGEETRSPEVVQQVAIALQIPDTQLIGFRVEETIAFGLENQGLPPAQIRQRITQVLAELNITHLRDRLTDQLSGGQKQVCVLAAILALDPPIIVLDEPTAALDPAGKQLVGQVVKRLKALGKTLIVSDSNLEWFQHLVDQTLVLSPEGRLLYSGELREFLSNRSLLEQSRIPRPALTDLSFALQQSGYDVPIWVEFAEANRWISTFLGAGKATASTATGRPSRSDLSSAQGEQSALPSAYGSHAPVEFAQSAPPSAPVVDCIDLTFTYADAPTPALSAVNFSANAGQILGIIGQNGSGKSTAVRHLNGLLRPQAGVVMVSGQQVARQTVAQMARRVGMAFQNPDLMLFNETVEQEALFSVSLAHDARWQQQRQLEVEALLEQFGLAQYRTRSPLALSVGQKQLLSILCALSLDPEVLVLDEPTFGMDQRGREQLGQILRQLKQQHKTILCISHDLPLLADYADQLLVFRDGQVAARGSTRSLLANSELFTQLQIPLPSYIQLGTDWLHQACLTPAELAHCLVAALPAVH